jgi:hypothetical protein
VFMRLPSSRSPSSSTAEPTALSNPKPQNTKYSYMP